MLLGDEYETLIETHIIPKNILEKYNSKERANGKLISLAKPDNSHFVEKAVHFFQKVSIGKTRKNAINFTEFTLSEFLYNDVIHEVYHELKNKSIYTIINSFQMFYFKQKQMLNKSTLSVFTNLLKKINQILKCN